jgi:hypothetical protein
VPSEQKTHRPILFVLYLIRGLLIFLFGTNYFRYFPNNKNALYEWGLTLVLLLLAELLDKNQFYVNLSEIDDTQFKVSEEDKALNKAFYEE